MVRVRDISVVGPAAPAGAAMEVEVRAHVSGLNRTGSAHVPVRVYEPGPRDLQGRKEPWGTLVWAHGGSFVRGTLDWPESDWVSRRFAMAGLRVYSVDYVLASDAVKAPAPSNDVAAVLREVRASFDGPVFVGGASAGGHLAVLAALAMADLAVAHGDAPAPPEALALVYPTLHRVQRPDENISALTASLPEERRFGAERVAEMYGFYLGEDPSSSSSTYVVGELPADRLAALPSTVIVNAEVDDLRASAQQFAWQLREAGVAVIEYVQPGTVHGYLNRPEGSASAVDDARDTIDLVVHGLLGALAQGPRGGSPDGQPSERSRGRVKPVGNSLLLYPPVESRRFPVGTGRVFWRVFGAALVIVAGFIGMDALLLAVGTRLVDVPRWIIFITVFVIVIAGTATMGAMTRLYARMRAGRIRGDTSQAFVVNQLQQCEETYYELRALGGQVPRSGQFGYLTFGVSPQGLDIRVDLGAEALNLPRERVREVRIVPRLMVRTGGRKNPFPYEAIVFDIQCKRGVRQLSFIVGDPRWLGLRFVQGEALQELRHEIERALSLD